MEGRLAKNSPESYADIDPKKILLTLEAKQSFEDDIKKSSEQVKE